MRLDLISLIKPRGAQLRTFIPALKTKLTLRWPGALKLAKSGNLAPHCKVVETVAEWFEQLE